MNRLLYLFLFLFVCNQIHAQEPLLQNIYGRNATSLNGKWKAIVDPYETGFYDYRFMAFDEVENTDPAYGGFYIDKKAQSKTERVEYDFDLSESLFVPGDWNSQKEKLFYYEGSIWYRKKFDYNLPSGKRLFLHFGATNYESDVYLNGKKLGKHIGGFTPFNFEITELVNDGENSLILKVDNKRKREAVPTLNTDWWNYGGITRDVHLVEEESTFISDYKIQLAKGNLKLIKGYILLDGKGKANADVKLTINELKISKTVKTDENGKATFDIPVKKLSYWSPDNPKLYDVQLSMGKSKVKDEIGFRTIEVKGIDILLNGKPLYLKGICIHEENPIRGGRANSVEDAQMLLGWVKELKGNFARLAHYPHNEYMAKTADKLGILLWEENPVYWTIQWKNKSTLENAKNQLSELMSRDKNRASVIIWSMANETPVKPERTLFLQELAQLAKSIDDTRLISAALEKHADKDNPLKQVVEDPFAEALDVLSFNQYIGWYDGLPEKCDKVSWEIKYNKPVIISEFGGGSLQGFHADSLTIWSEEFQEDLYRRTLKMLDKVEKVKGITPWIIADFRSPKRMLPYIQDGWNRKGIISEKGIKKKAFYILQDYYSKK